MSQEAETTILLADDDPANLDLLSAVLMDEGYQVVAVKDGAKAIEVAPKVDPQVVLLDVVMPGMSGYEVCRQLRKTSEFKHVPILFLSGLTEQESIVEGFHAGGVDYVSKPFNRKELLARIETHLQLTRLREEVVKKNATNESLLRVVTHDMANQLQAIAPLAELGVRLSQDEKSTDFFERILSCSENAASIISFVRKMIAVEAGKTQLILSPVSVAQVFDSCKKTFEHRLQEKGLQLESDPASIDPGVMVLAEPVSFQNSVMNNLVTNAIKFSYPGGTIRVIVEEAESTVIITVRDAGTGIQSERVANIFSPDHSTSTPGTEGELGTGFGMPLVYRYIKRYGATIEIESRHETEHIANHGTDVILTFEAAG